jgi:outer membrane protein assembly factor BamB
MIRLWMLLGIFVYLTGVTAFAQVRQAWVAFHDGPAHREDYARWITLDKVGNLYVTGSVLPGYAMGTDAVTIKYSPEGEVIWRTTTGRPGSYAEAGFRVALDPNDNVVMTGLWESRFNVAKLDVNGNLLWNSVYISGLNNSVSGMVIDEDGHVYVTGSTFTAQSYSDYVTIKYNGSTGETLWIARYSTFGSDFATAIALTPDGNIVVTGKSQGDFVTLQYDRATGTQLWLARYNGPVNGEDEARSVAVDQSGDVYVTGYSDGTGAGGSGYDYATIKYDGATGAQRWAARYDGIGYYRDTSTRILTDSRGGVYVAGTSGGTNRLNDYAVVKYDAVTGAERWVARYDGDVRDNDVVHAMALDASGNVYVTGDSVGAGSRSDWATVKYDSMTGRQRWLIRYNGSGNYEDQPRGIVVDPRGSVYVTGYSYSTTSLTDYTTIKYLQLEADVNRDGCIDDEDLLVTLFAFGTNDEDADVNGDGLVDDTDLLEVLFGFGNGC